MLHDQIMALVRQQFTAAEIAAQLGCSRADVYAAIDGPDVQYVEVGHFRERAISFWTREGEEWKHFGELA